MKKILLTAFLLFPAVTLAQNLILVCEGTEESRFNINDEVKIKPAVYTYVFKNGKLTETTTNVAEDSVKWTDNYIKIDNFKDGSTTTLIDRVSGRVSKSRYKSTNTTYMSINFEGFCKPASQLF